MVLLNNREELGLKSERALGLHRCIWGPVVRTVLQRRHRRHWSREKFGRIGPYVEPFLVGLPAKRFELAMERKRFTGLVEDISSLRYGGWILRPVELGRALVLRQDIVEGAEGHETHVQQPLVPHLLPTHREVPLRRVRRLQPVYPAHYRLLSEYPALPDTLADL